MRNTHESYLNVMHISVPYRLTYFRFPFIYRLSRQSFPLYRQDESSSNKSSRFTFKPRYLVIYDLRERMPEFSTDYPFFFFGLGESVPGPNHPPGLTPSEETLREIGRESARSSTFLRNSVALEKIGQTALPPDSIGILARASNFVRGNFKRWKCREKKENSRFPHRSRITPDFNLQFSPPQYGRTDCSSLGEIFSTRLEGEAREEESKGDIIIIRLPFLQACSILSFRAIEIKRRRRRKGKKREEERNYRAVRLSAGGEALF